MDPRSFLSGKGYKVLQKVGQGTYATVFKAIQQKDGTTVAIKAISVAKLSAKQTESTLNEIRIICSVSHPNIVKYYDAFIDEFNRDLYVIMEFLGGGDLSDNIEYMQKSNNHFSESQIWGYVLQILQGLAELHKRGVIHRDVKPANLFLSADKKGLKIGDMNTSKILQNDAMTQTVIGTPYYLAPEIWLNAKYDYRCDVFSLGCVVYEMAMLRPPFRASNVQELFKNVLKGYFAPLSKEYSRDLSDFIKVCLIGNIKKRPSASKLLQTDVVRHQLKSHPQLDYRRKGQKNKSLVWSQIKIPRTIQEMNEVLNDYRSMSQDMGIQRRCLSELRSKNRFKLKNSLNPRKRNPFRNESARSAALSLNNSKNSSRRFQHGFKKKVKMIPNRKPPQKRRPPKITKKVEPTRPRKQSDSNFHSKRAILKEKKKKKYSKKGHRSNYEERDSQNSKILKSDSKSGLKKKSSQNLYSDLKIKKDKMKQTLSKQSLHHITKPVPQKCPPFAVPPKILSQGYINVQGIQNQSNQGINTNDKKFENVEHQDQELNIQTKGNHDSENLLKSSGEENKKMRSSIARNIKVSENEISIENSKKNIKKYPKIKTGKRKLRSVPELSSKKQVDSERTTYYHQSKKRRNKETKNSRFKHETNRSTDKRNKSANTTRNSEKAIYKSKVVAPKGPQKHSKYSKNKKMPPKLQQSSSQKIPNLQTRNIHKNSFLNNSQGKKEDYSNQKIANKGSEKILPGDSKPRPKFRIFGTIYEGSKDFSASGQNDSTDIQNKLKKTRSTQMKSITDSVGLKSKENNLSRPPKERDCDRESNTSRQSRSQPKKLFPIFGHKKSKTPKLKVSRFKDESTGNSRIEGRSGGSKKFSDRFGIKNDSSRGQRGYKRRYTVGSRNNN